MGRLFKRSAGADAACGSVATATVTAQWPDSMVDAARASGSFPYVVEGFFEISDAVRRGDPVVLRREPAIVAEGITVFEGSAGDADDVVTITAFDVRTARYTVSDPKSATGAVELTPKRLQCYLVEPSRSLGVALGA